EVLSDAMPALPKWAKLGGSFVWAPEMIQIGEQFVLYYTARDKAADKQCIGVATAAKPEGKFKDTNEQALVCQADEGGSIDPSPFRDGDKLYLYWKNDGNCCSKPTYIYAQELAPDGLSLVGEPVRLLRNDATWEGTLIEAPTMVRHADAYVMFFSANFYAGEQYAVGYATCQGALGPCQDAPENPVLSSLMDRSPPVVGPGHQDIVEVGGETWLVYHAWEILSSGLRGDRRFMWMDRVEWKDDRPDILGPTLDPQPRPAAP
ncbi:MAG TPA: glycoside hydrolase family 43 protein, partial [Herpetosiphonaceae bacterium]|nr:glycoside hydrolase family 43 protein [Herpetosiphonaceae bacterium]